MIANIKTKAKQLKKQIVIIYIAYMHKDVKWYHKAFLLLIIAYAASPVDLIPDFIPVLGLLDDLILIPLGVIVAIKIIPEEVWEECRLKAENGVSISRGYKTIGVVLITVIWVIVLFLIIRNFRWVWAYK